MLCPQDKPTSKAEDVLTWIRKTGRWPPDRPLWGGGLAGTLPRAAPSLLSMQIKSGQRGGALNSCRREILPLPLPTPLLLSSQRWGTQREREREKFIFI